MPGSV
jgi:hypothetical protein